MNTAEIRDILQRWADAIGAAYDALEQVKRATGLDPQAPLPEAVYRLLDIADDWAAEAIGTAPDWLVWFRLENQMGARGHEAGWDDDLRAIHTLDDFADLLAEDVRRAAEVGEGD